jgi:hypothetical protein
MEELAEQSITSGLGWTANWDIQLQKWIFDVIEGRDLTVNFYKKAKNGES